MILIAKFTGFMCFYDCFDHNYKGAHYDYYCAYMSIKKRKSLKNIFF